MDVLGRPGSRDRLKRLLIALALGGWAVAETGQGLNFPQRPAAEEELLLLELRLDHLSLSEGFPAYPRKESYLLPLGELCRELELAIQVDPAKGLAEGFLIEETRPFRLDVRARSMTVGKVTKPLDPALLEIRNDDIYLDSRLLAQCLPLGLAVNLRASTLTVTPREPLPLQLRKKREQEGRFLGKGSAPKAFAPLEDPYRLFEVPAMDLDLALGSNAPGAGARPFNAKGSLLAAGDFLHMSGSAYALAQDPGGVTDAHFTLGRRDPHAGLLGPLRATEVGLGEMLSPGLNLALNPLVGTGVLLGNYPLQRSNTFDRHSFQGDLPPGWQVELYQNQGLVAFQGARPDGRYEFLGVPLYFGLNEFRLAFYGPQGERREETIRFDVSQSQTPAGAFFYDFSDIKPHGLLGNRTAFQASYGLTERLTAVFGTASSSLSDSRHTYTELGLQGFWKPLSGGFTAAQDSLGGSVLEGALRTRLGFLSLVGKEAVLRDGFSSEIFPLTNGGIRQRGTLEATAVVPNPQHPWFTLDLGGYEDQWVAGGSMKTYHGGLSTALGNLFLSNQIMGTVTRGLAAPAPAATSGEFLASKLFPALALRGQASYALSGGTRLRALSLTADVFRCFPYLFQAAFIHGIQDRQSTVKVGMSKPQGAYALGATLAYSTLTRLSATLSFRLGLARDPHTGSFYTRAQGTAAFGAVSSQAFLDTNGNGIRDSGEKTVANASFLVNEAHAPGVTDAGGVALLTGLPEGVDAHITLNPSSLEDPLMASGRPGVRVTPRPGHTVQLEVPIVSLSEITGTVYRFQGGAASPWPGVNLELKDAGGRILKTQRTAYDGFYTLSELPSGSCTLGLSQAEARRLGAQAPPPKALTLAPEGSMLDGVDFRITVPNEEAKP